MREKLCLEKIIEAGFKIILFVGESEEDWWYDYADQIGINRFIPNSINSLVIENKFKKLNADSFVLCGYSKILKK